MVYNCDVISRAPSSRYSVLQVFSSELGQARTYLFGKEQIFVCQVVMRVSQTNLGMVAVVGEKGGVL